MLNKDLFELNPLENNLKNDGVVELNTSKDEKGQQIIYHEIKTFVCEGEYERGLYRILDTYLKKFDEPKQPAVWVSGFFGSGKSHLIKMLTYFWEDFTFDNGENARKIKSLPDNVNDLLVELQRKQEIHGSLVVRGTLKDFPSKDLKYSFIRLLLTSLNLPNQLHLFQFYHWCKSEGILDGLKEKIKNSGKDFDSELKNLYVSRIIANAILELLPDYAENEAQVRENFKYNFPRKDTIGREDFLYTVKSQILKYVSDNIPCILIALDEIQQFIGTDQDRSSDV